MRVRGIIASSVRPASAPSVAVSSTTNYNQNRATFNGTVSANGSTTTSIKFQISTNGGSTWSDATGGTSISNTSSQNVSVYYNATGLSEGTSYLVRLVASNGVATSTSGTTSFTTWSLQVYERSTSGGTTFTIPTVTPTGGSAVSVSIYDIIMFGGGGGGSFNAGGGGGYISQESAALSGTRSVTTSVGSGGSGGSTGNATNGGNTTISGDLTTLTANGGNAGGVGSGGSSGNSNAGGTSQDYNGQSPPKGEPDTSNTGFGGGGGAGGAGGNGSAGSWGAQGGNGGAGVSITRGGVTRAGGAGGAGGASALESGTATRGSIGSNNTYGSGGRGSLTAQNDWGNGQSGYIRFRYYA